MRSILAGLLLLTAAPAAAQVVATDPRATLTGHDMARVTAVLTSRAPDELVGASSPAGGAMVHTVARRGAGAVMVKTSVRLPAGQARPLSVHGNHVMLTGLSGMRQGQAIPVTLTFAHAAPVVVQAIVQ